MLNGVRYVSPDGTYTSRQDADAWLSRERRKIENDEWRPFDQRPGSAPKPEPKPKPPVSRESQALTSWWAR